ncbi:hypothetical protein K450DRAFT_252668 [Umbelopsis ramanniana AG]|uniref:Uncharacterized protein n=1 Tax=Umbelopsis ramanniana AG TaxID=1314678 RepID=A0AAD5HBY9_UMBRA|nr:uncharacterized protein K450DRAFT_252668 [Umbelopsis ramanniana AG]KAI8577334.1 hypothetical protein K450DRAFT_252668 [Umbelopsis ramanniana AG]
MLNGYADHPHSNAGRAICTDFPLALETHCPFCQWPGPNKWNCLVGWLKPFLSCRVSSYRRAAVHSLVRCNHLGDYHRGYPERNLDHFQEDSPWHSRVDSQRLQTFQTGTFGNTLEPLQLMCCLKGIRDLKQVHVSELKVRKCTYNSAVGKKSHHRYSRIWQRQMQQERQWQGWMRV